MGDARFWDLYERYAGRLLAYVKTLVRGRSDLEAEDICHDVWLRAYRRGRKSMDEGYAERWIFTVARNMVVDASRRKRAVDAPDLDRTAAASDATVGTSIVQREESRLLAECLERLAAEQPDAAAVVRAVLGGESYDAICARLDVTPNRAYKLKHQAVRSLRECVKAAAA